MADLNELTQQMRNIPPGYEIYFDQVAQRGVILTRLDSKLNEVRSYRINWESYYQNNMIPLETFHFVKRYDRLSKEEKTKAFQQESEQSIVAFLSLIKGVTMDHIIEYILVMIDDVLKMNPEENVKLFHEVALNQECDIWAPFISILDRDGAISMQMAARVISKFASFSRVRSPESVMLAYVTWLKDQLLRSSTSSEYLHDVAECVTTAMRIDEYRLQFVKADGINSLVSVLLSAVGFQLQYKLIFSFWLLSFHVKIAAIIGESNVIPILCDILRNSQKEKVTRIVIATFRNLLQKPDDSKIASVSLIQSKVLPTLNVLGKNNWADEDIKEDLEYISEKLQESVQNMSTWDEYVAEVKSGRLEWSPVHRQEKFWRENAINICDKNYELLKVLVQLLKFSPDPQIQAIACHDLGEFIRHYPRAKPAFDTLGCKELIMNRMSHDDENVKYEALVAVQKLLVQNWHFLGKMGEMTATE